MRPLYSILLFLASTTLLFGKAALLSKESALNDSHLIAHLRILDVADLTSGNGYKRTSRAEVITPVKGCKENEVVNIDHDTGYVCPNVSYSANEEVFVFAEKNANGHYETMHTYCGRFNVKDGKVLSFNLFDDTDTKQTTVDISLEELVAQLKKLLQKKS
jgi:hypothetical protein